MRKSRENLSGRGGVEIVLPATSANLGPAFDAAALAMDLHLRLQALPAAGFRIRAAGRDAAICARLENHLILETYRDVLRSEGLAAVPLALTIKNEIPIGKGCGSSAAARLAGIALAVHFGGLGWKDARVIGEASRREHHPDNAAACWLGGVVTARMAGEAEAQFARLRIRTKWPLLLAIPQESLATEEARKVLPASYPRADAVANIQNAMLLLAGLEQGRADLLRASLEDRIHQPYRSRLCPLLPALKSLPLESGVLGAVLSGAGPTVLMFVDPGADAGRVRREVGRHLRQQGMRAELVSASISGSGREVKRI